MLQVIHAYKLSKITPAPAEVEEQENQLDKNSDFRPPSPIRTR